MFTTLTGLDLGIVALSAIFFTACSWFCFQRASEHTAQQPLAKIGPKTVMWFEFDLKGRLVCANLEATQFLYDLDLVDPNWPTFRRVLAGRFAGLPQNAGSENRFGNVILPPISIADPTELEIDHHANGLTLTMLPRSAVPKDTRALHETLVSLPDLDLMRAASEQAPFPVWQTFSNGDIGWSNTCYKSLDKQIKREHQNLFTLPENQGTTQKPARVTLKDTASNRTFWFDVSQQKFNDGFVNFAIDIHAVVNAEMAQRNFVQTLAKTFAHLATGLAIFDRNRQLVLFNPALFDLTDLKPEFLTARPNLFSFFDQLRDNQIMPEPKNYANWRERIADVISAASDDNFNETWHLPNGLTYRITGRPHPDGAIAFLFEDISAEISLTRRFRSEADVTRSALDAIEQGIAIFNRAGFLQQSNTAMETFIGRSLEHDGASGLSAHDISRMWQGICKPTPAWGEIRDFIAGASERETWSTTIKHKNGQLYDVRVSPLASGASLVTIAAAPAQVSKSKSRRSGKASNTVAA